LNYLKLGKFADEYVGDSHQPQDGECTPETMALWLCELLGDRDTLKKCEKHLKLNQLLAVAFKFQTFNSIYVRFNASLS
jgi:hypothetical protein